jgi:hypothetical protein
MNVLFSFTVFLKLSPKLIPSHLTTCLHKYSHVTPRYENTVLDFRASNSETPLLAVK